MYISSCYLAILILLRDNAITLSTFCVITIFIFLQTIEMYISSCYLAVLILLCESNSDSGSDWDLEFESESEESHTSQMRSLASMHTPCPSPRRLEFMPRERLMAAQEPRESPPAGIRVRGANSPKAAMAASSRAAGCAGEASAVGARPAALRRCALLANLKSRFKSVRRRREGLGAKAR